MAFKYTIDKNINFLLFDNTLINIIGHKKLLFYSDNYFIVNKKLTNEELSCLKLGVEIINIEKVCFKAWSVSKRNKTN